MRGRKRKLPENFVPAKWATSSSESEYDIPLDVRYPGNLLPGQVSESDNDGGNCNCQVPTYKASISMNALLFNYKNVNVRKRGGNQKMTNLKVTKILMYYDKKDKKFWRILKLLSHVMLLRTRNIMVKRHLYIF